jgi:hypothetical protein
VPDLCHFDRPPALATLPWRPIPARTSHRLAEWNPRYGAP